MTLDEIKRIIAQLPPNELTELREWLVRFDGEQWDKQIELDITDNNLESAAKVALHDFRSGQTKRL